MRKKLIFLIIVIVVTISTGMVYTIASNNSPSSENLIYAKESPIGFLRADGPRKWQFPNDYGPHSAYQTEWWYYTGNLEAESGEKFGYQLTFFRRSLIPVHDQSVRRSAWATNQVYMAHFALTDISSAEHYAFERFSRGSAGLAGAKTDPFKVWLKDWEVEQIDDGKFKLDAYINGIRLDLILEDTKGPVLNGDRGYSQKGPDPGNASYYYSQTRLETSGNVRTANKSYQVSGLSWKDHEFSTSALSRGQVGWDWFSIQFDEGSELMVFQIRRDDGSIDPFSSGTWIKPGGDVIHLNRDQFNLQVRDFWVSPNSGAEYPSEWRLFIPAVGIELSVIPFLADQEMDLSYVYWEGAVKSYGTINGTPISGSGYVELTGYSASMEGQF